MKTTYHTTTTSKHTSYLRAVMARKASLGANWKATITAGRGVVEITKHSLR